MIVPTLLLIVSTLLFLLDYLNKTERYTSMSLITFLVGMALLIIIMLGKTIAIADATQYKCFENIAYEGTSLNNMKPMTFIDDAVTYNVHCTAVIPE